MAPDASKSVQAQAHEHSPHSTRTGRRRLRVAMRTLWRGRTGEGNGRSRTPSTVGVGGRQRGIVSDGTGAFIHRASAKVCSRKLIGLLATRSAVFGNIWHNYQSFVIAPLVGGKDR